MLLPTWFVPVLALGTLAGLLLETRLIVRRRGFDLRWRTLPDLAPLVWRAVWMPYSATRWCWGLVALLSWSLFDPTFAVAVIWGSVWLSLGVIGFPRTSDPIVLHRRGLGPDGRRPEGAPLPRGRALRRPGAVAVGVLVCLVPPLPIVLVLGFRGTPDDPAGITPHLLVVAALVLLGWLMARVYRRTLQPVVRLTEGFVVLEDHGRSAAVPAERIVRVSADGGLCLHLDDGSTEREPAVLGGGLWSGCDRVRAERVARYAEGVREALPADADRQPVAGYPESPGYLAVLVGLAFFAAS